MIEADAAAWAWFSTMVLASVMAGLALAGCLPLALSDRTAGLRRAIGVALSPFLLGLASVITLAVARGASVPAQRFAILGVLAGVILLCLALWRLPGSFSARPSLATPSAGAAPTAPWTVLDLLLAAIIAAAAAVLLVHALMMPLTQNDSLEYVLAARRLYDTRDLAAYPPIDSAADPLGFYGPWTHPPLYPALIHASMLCDGAIWMPGLMRLISPWALLACTGLVGALGGQAGRRAGLAAAALCLTTPLLMLGADSALLDALSATACALMIAMLVTLDWRRPVAAPLAAGAVLGIVIWAHSQMVLLALIVACAAVLLGGLRGARGLRDAGWMLAIALAISVWPFLANLERTGSVISDNPAVFALAQQDWPGYFRASRDLSTLVSRIQYGVFKGWHALEAYGLVFWVMLGAWWLALRRLVQALRHDPWAPLPARDPATVGALVFSVYFGGMCLSLVVGVDLMIKTERYLLMTIPAVALLAGHGLAAAATLPPRPALFRRLLAAAAVLPVIFMALQVAAMSQYRLGMFAIGPSQLLMPLEDKLARFAPWQATRYLREHTPPEALVFSLKPSDMLYARRRMLSYLDPVLLPAYAETDAAAMSARLAALGVSHVHAPDYPLPPLYHSALQPLLADPRLAALVADFGGQQVYALGDSGARVCQVADLMRTGSPWQRSQTWSFGGRKRLAAADAVHVEPASPADAQRPLPAWFQRDRVTRIVSAPMPLRLGAACGEGAEWRLDLDLAGSGFASVQALLLDDRGGVREELSLGGIPVAAQGTTRWQRRLLIPEGVAAVRWVVEHRGTARIGVVTASASRIVGTSQAGPRQSSGPGAR
ncbi:MAG TPA: hypothetical protein PK306_03450 [Aquabacterium sp.]|nr:hypothetical protein [Aquabacterium sp.]HQC94747.1 hypothetical protein [Aquabacterium sp.]